MADPTKYDPDYSYTGFQQSQGDNSFPGTTLDNDLQKIGRSVNETIDALKQVRRSDGKLQNGIVTRESLSDGLLLGMEAPIAWVVGTEYEPPVYVKVQNNIYRCVVKHVAVDFPNDLEAGYWIVVVDLQTAVDEAEASAEGAASSAGAAAGSATSAGVSATLSAAWAISPTPPDANDPTSESSRTAAARSTAEADSSEGFAEVSLVQANRAETEADRAQSIADALPVTGQIYVDVATGRAAVLNGQTYLVQGATANVFAHLYRRIDAATSTNLNRDLPSLAAVNELLSFAVTSTEWSHIEYDQPTKTKALWAVSTTGLPVNFQEDTDLTISNWDGVPSAIWGERLFDTTGTVVYEGRLLTGEEVDFGGDGLPTDSSSAVTTSVPDLIPHGYPFIVIDGLTVPKSIASKWVNYCIQIGGKVWASLVGGRFRINGVLYQGYDLLCEFDVVLNKTTIYFIRQAENTDDHEAGSITILPFAGIKYPFIYQQCAHTGDTQKTYRSKSLSAAGLDAGIVHDQGTSTYNQDHAQTNNPKRQWNLHRMTTNSDWRYQIREDDAKDNVLWLRVFSVTVRQYPIKKPLKTSDGEVQLWHVNPSRPRPEYKGELRMTKVMYDGRVMRMDGTVLYADILSAGANLSINPFDGVYDGSGNLTGLGQGGNLIKKLTGTQRMRLESFEPISATEYIAIVYQWTGTEADGEPAAPIDPTTCRVKLLFITDNGPGNVPTTIEYDVGPGGHGFEGGGGDDGDGGSYIGGGAITGPGEAYYAVWDATQPTNLRGQLHKITFSKLGGVLSDTLVLASSTKIMRPHMVPTITGNVSACSYGFGDFMFIHDGNPGSVDDGYTAFGAFDCDTPLTYIRS